MTGAVVASAAMHEEDDCLEDTLAYAMRGREWPAEEPAGEPDAAPALRIEGEFEDTSSDPDMETGKSTNTSTRPSSSSSTSSSSGSSTSSSSSNSSGNGTGAAQYTVVAGLEILGTVRVLVPEMVLGVPSATNETVYAPFESVRIVIPAGAWVVRGGRGLAPLTLTVFVLPPGHRACGVAVDLGPRDQALASPISIALPCTPLRGRAHRLNATDGRWEADTPLGSTEDSVWGGTRLLGVHAALTDEEPRVVTLGSSGSPSVGIAVGASFGALAVASLAVGGIVSARRGRAKGKTARSQVAASAETDLCFSTEV
jgi:hypothetical protein